MTTKEGQLGEGGGGGLDKQCKVCGDVIIYCTCMRDDTSFASSTAGPTFARSKASRDNKLRNSAADD